MLDEYDFIKLVFDSNMEVKIGSLSTLDGAVMILNECTEKDTFALPNQILDNLVDAAQDLQAAIEASLNGDDFLGLFILCVILSKLGKPNRMALYARSLSNPKVLLGKRGYFLTVFEACLHWIATRDYPM